jgi:hypothetical protein
MTVYIGRDAFENWSVLGSTLGHEIEIHCQQSFFMIHLFDLFGFDGTGEAERQAYLYELANAERFGLGQYDQNLILSTMSYFYPEITKGHGLVDNVKGWLSRLAFKHEGSKPLSARSRSVTEGPGSAD